MPKEMKRREFLEKSMAGSAGIIAGASGILVPSCKSPNERIVLALIGAGSRGRQTIISCCRGNENVSVKTVCDVNDLNSARTADAIEKELGYTPGVTM